MRLAIADRTNLWEGAKEEVMGANYWAEKMNPANAKGRIINTADGYFNGDGTFNAYKS